ncbi:MAG TPA: hypothetical protein VF179_18870 [Thermoanaerobaculia bacterium]|nr:hypothetical protein [Thermoanaerobaculia bacterium]
MAGRSGRGAKVPDSSGSGAAKKHAAQKRRKSPSSEGDGGRNALAGFLFQILETAWLRLYDLTGNQTTDDELNATAVFHEAFGQDASRVANSNEVVLVQYKYSRRPDARIAKAGWLDIAQRLVVSEKKATAAGYQVKEVRLVTNRVRGPRLSSALRAFAQKGASAPEAERMALRINYEQVNEERATESLVQFLGGYGAFRHEVDLALNAWIGELVRSTAGDGDVLVRKENLFKHLLGTERPASLRLPELLPRLKEDVERFRADYAERPSRAIHRSVADDIAAEVGRAAQPVVVVSGEGGVGKTTALVEFAEQRLAPPATAPTGILAAGSPLAEGGVPELLRHWSGLTAPGSARRDDSFEHAVERLVVANPGLARPYVCLCLDGADEVDGALKQRLQSIIHSFLRPALRGLEPPAVLVITCRNEQSLRREFFPVDVTTGASRYEDYGRVHVGVFDDQEFDLAAAGLDADVAARLDVVRPFTLGTQLQSSFSQLATYGSVPASDPGDPEIIDALHHPIVWKAFEAMTPADQHEVLSRTEVGVDRLGDNLLAWFCAKAAMRNQVLKNEKYVRWGLALAAEATFTRGIWDELDWVRAVRQEFPHEIAAALYSEAVSAGLIEEVDDSARWSHGFVPEMLVRMYQARMRRPA